MASYKKVQLKTAGGEYVYPEIDPSATNGVFVINYTHTEPDPEIGGGEHLVGDKT